MARKQAGLGPERKSGPRPIRSGPVRWERFVPLILVLAVVVCFWTPLTSSNTSIQWDAADEFQIIQKYFSDELHAGRMPFWTPYVWSGYPFLADPQVGAWFPPNWPFFLIGVSPRAMQFELFLAAIFACVGGYLFAHRLVRDRAGAAVTGLCYGLSGFFASHSSHTPIVQAAACLPWLLWLFLRAVESNPLRNGTLAVLFSGLMILAGHFQTALYGFLALGLVALAQCIAQPAPLRRIALLALAVPLGGTALSAIATLPGLELAGASIRTGLAAINRTEGMIVPQSLLTLISPDHYGVISGNYKGPSDITQYYYYAGLLLVPLALVGLRNRSIRWTGILLTLIPVWYGLGHRAGLYLLLARLPGFNSVRAPANGWFVPAMGLALLAGAGLASIRRKWPMNWVAVLAIMVIFADIWYWNFEKNPLAYARTSYEELYGKGQRVFESAIASIRMPALTRFDGADRISTFGPMNHALDARVEVAYGYGPLVLRAYDEYTSAMRSNAKLRNGLNVSRYLDPQRGGILANPDVLPRVYFAKSLLPAASEDESRRLLSTLDPAEKTIVPAKFAGLAQDPAAKAEVTGYSSDGYRIHYSTRSDSLLRVATAYYPGWQAHIDGRTAEVVRADHALLGVVARSGEHDILLQYRSNWFGLGVFLTVAGTLLCLAILVWPLRSRIFQG